jgi:hypothetical protein
MLIATCNSVGNDTLNRKQVRKIARIAGNHAGLIGFQELKTGQDIFDTETGLGRVGGKELEVLLAEWSTPIGMDFKKYTPLQGGANEFHSPVAGLTPRRQVTWEIFEFTQRPNLGPVAMTNGHVINKGPENDDLSWDDLGRFSKGTEQRLRFELHQQSWEVWHDTVAWLQKEFKVPVLVTGDFNNREVAKFKQRMQWWNDSGIDKIGYVPHPRSNVRMKFDWTATFKTPSDHRLKVVKAEVTKKR